MAGTREKRGRTRKLTPNQQHYEALINRGRRIVQRNAQEGNVLVNYTLPEVRPKRVTKKALQELDKMTSAETINQASVFVDIQTGEVITDTETANRLGLTQEMVQNLNRDVKVFTDLRNFNSNRLKGWEATVIGNFLDSVSGYNAQFQATVRQWIIKLISVYGYNKTARMLEEGAQNGNIITYKEVYEDGAFTAYVARMISYLPDDEIYGQEVKDALFNNMENYTPPERNKETIKYARRKNKQNQDVVESSDDD